MKQRKPFTIRFDAKDKANLQAMAAQAGKPYGIFFDTSGKARIEPINPTAQYSYLWRTDIKN